MNILMYYLARNVMLTVIIELVLAVIIGVRNKKDFIIIILVNIFTNPLVNVISFLFNVYLGTLIRNIILLIMEISAVIVEGYIYKKNLYYKGLNPFVLSIILNITSYGFGVIINYLI